MGVGGDSERMNRERERKRKREKRKEEVGFRRKNKKKKFLRAMSISKQNLSAWVSRLKLRYQWTLKAGNLARENPAIS